MLLAWKAAKNDPSVASFRYRVMAPITALTQRGHRVEIYDPARHDLYDYVVFSKSYGEADQAIARRLKAAGKKVALDLCDNHLYNPFDLPRYRRARTDLLQMVALADQVICSTPTLADVLLREAELAHRPAVVGDMAELIEVPQRRPAAERASLLWFGSHGSPNAESGMNDLLLISSHLREAAQVRPFELVVASNNNEKFAALAPHLPVPARYVEWSRASFPAILADADAVLIPLSRNPFVACKTHNRMTTALGAGLPVVADTIDSYREFAPYSFLDDWRTGLRSVLENSESARARACQARPYIESHWSMEQLAPQWEAALGLGAAITVTSGTPGARTPRASGTRSYQGALDIPGTDRICGWVRMPSQPGLAVTVELRSEGHTLATALANHAREDLKTAGFPQVDCGFEIEIPAAYCDGARRPFELIAGNGWSIGTVEARFVRMPVAAAEPLPFPAQKVEAFPVPAAESAGVLPQVQPANSDAHLDLQRQLASDLEELCEAVETVRRVSSRMVLAASEGGLKGDVPALAGAKPGDLARIPRRWNALINPVPVNSNKRGNERAN